MENQIERVKPIYRVAFFVFILTAVAALFFALGLLFSQPSLAQGRGGKSGKRVVYPKKTNLEFEGINIEGVINNPAEFYFKHRKPERFKSLVDVRKNFHREMLRDVVMSK